VNAYDGTTYTPAGGGTPITFDPVNGSLATVNGTATTAVPFPTIDVAGMAVTLRGTTQYTSSSILLSQSQDGFAAGNLMKIAIDENGYVNGHYSNGQLQRIAQIALARFASPNGLEKIGGSLYGETVASGIALIDSSSAINNKIFSNSLEQSNVDMAGQLVKMITTQRAYSASSKTITTADEMLQETLNLKR
jgi:flagellar hook protein FlgE